MKNEKFQVPTSKEVKNLKHQTKFPARRELQNRAKSLNPGVSLVLGVCCLVLSLAVAWAQTYSIDWHTIDGGGGTSTGGVYSVSGTIGQPDAGAMSGGNYSLTGGFWALPTAVQVVDAPALLITPATPGQATILWTPNSPGFVLQETSSLSPTNWVNSASGTTNPIVVPTTVPTKFYRLFKL